MRAIVQDKYGSPDVLELREIDKPALGGNDVLVRVFAAAVNPGDWFFLKGDPYVVVRVVAGVRRPKNKVLGLAVAGQVEAVGTNVTRFQPGNEVFAEVAAGGFAEYVRVPEHLLGLKPANLTFAQAAAVPLSATTALQGLRDAGRLQQGQKILINGASGGVGTFAVQIAKTLGAQVTGVCSTRNVELVRSIGADQIIDYTRDDFTLTGQRWDVILELVGNHSLSDCRRALTLKGTLVLSSGRGGRWFGPLGRIVAALVLSPFVSQRMVALVARPNKADLDVLKELIEAGKIRPVIDRQYPLSEVPDAIGYFGQGHARGKVVIAV
jgi:NADPH:quinone reductase-like Zn-dependent oxidoreductase